MEAWQGTEDRGEVAAPRRVGAGHDLGFWRGLFKRADIVALPYREIDQSGVLHTALAFGKPLVLSNIGGFTEGGEEHHAARLVPPADPGALADAIRELLADPAEQRRLGDAAIAVAAGPFSWDTIAGADAGSLRGVARP